jgi:hypothetical protein
MRGSHPSRSGLPDHILSLTTAANHWTPNFPCAIGEGDPEKLWPRYRRFEFDDACRIL